MKEPCEKCKALFQMVAVSSPGAAPSTARATAGRLRAAAKTSVANIKSEFRRAIMHPPARCHHIVQRDGCGRGSAIAREFTLVLVNSLLDRIRQLEVLLGDAALIMRR